MPLDRNSLAGWLDGYVKAWLSYDRDAIGALFSEDATYAWHPWDTGPHVARGRAEIVKAWLNDKDKPGTYQAEYAPLAIDGNLAIATGRSRYFAKNGTLKREYYNCFVMQFDDDGQCTSFTEWYMKAP
jgi:hypothetical protein